MPIFARGGRGLSRSVTAGAGRGRFVRPWTRLPSWCSGQGRRCAEMRALVDICGICSVNDRRGHLGARHHQRRLHQRPSNPLSP